MVKERCRACQLMLTEPIFTDILVNKNMEKEIFDIAHIRYYNMITRIPLRGI